MPGQQRRAAAQQGREPTGTTSGAGRRDEVGRTGIYPATGPYPEGDDLEVLTPDEINRGPDHRSLRGFSEDLKKSERLPRRGNEEDKPDSDRLGD